MDQKSVQKPPTRIQRKNREAILAAALEVFSKFGFRGATLDQIANAALMSKPNVLYYYTSKDAIYTTLMERLLATWLQPLKQLDDAGDPIEELISYMRRKLELSRDYPRESRLFANEILQGAPRMIGNLKGELRSLVDEKVAVLDRWRAEGKISAVDPYHLMFSIWSLTQHYADFDVQIRAVLDSDDPFSGAEDHLEMILRRTLKP